MDALKSTALVPGEPEYQTEFNLLNLLLVKIPKHVDIRPILNLKPLQPRHIVALQELHSELFPIRYDPRFFEVACSTQCGFLDSRSICDIFDFSEACSRDLDWYENRIMAFGLFLPRSYVSFFRRTGQYEVEKYLDFLVRDGEYSEFDDPLSEMLIFDSECDEFMVGFVTLLINQETTNNLISDDDYPLLGTFYKHSLLPLLNTPETETDPEELAMNGELGGSDGGPPAARSVSEGTKIRNCVKLNRALIDDTLYAMLYNQLYTNAILLDYAANFNIRAAKSIYILSTGITLGLRRRSLGTNLILVVQLLVYYLTRGIYIHRGEYYTIRPPPAPSLAQVGLAAGEADFGPHRARSVLNVLRLHYNSKLFSCPLLAVFYHFVLDIAYTPYQTYGVESLLTRYESEGPPGCAAPDKAQVDGDEFYDVDNFEGMPIVIYLHTIHYNAAATRMYENLNFYKVATISDYYNIDGKRYDANFLAHYVCP